MNPKDLSVFSLQSTLRYKNVSDSVFQLMSFVIV
jgi:hypothetical protein